MTYKEALFGHACLVGAVALLYGMLSIQRGAFHERKEKLSRLYGHPPEPPGGSSQARFIKAFCGRPTFIIGIFTALLFIRNYSEPYVSLFLAFVISAYLLGIVRSLETKFIPSMFIFVCLTYSALHLAGLMYGWHDDIHNPAAAIHNEASPGSGAGAMPGLVPSDSGAAGAVPSTQAA